MGKRGPLAVIGIGFFICAIALFLGFRASSGQPRPSPSPSPTASPTAEAATVAGWPTFTSQGGWSMQYPSNWVVDSCHGCSDVTDPDVWVSFSTYHQWLGDPFPANWEQGTVTVEPMEDCSGDSACAKAPGEDTRAYLFRLAGLNPMVADSANAHLISLAGKQALEEDSSESIRIIVSQGSRPLKIDFSGSAENVAAKDLLYYPLYRQMIGTLSFAK